MSSDFGEKGQNVEQLDNAHINTLSSFSLNIYNVMDDGAKGKRTGISRLPLTPLSPGQNPDRAPSIYWKRQVEARHGRDVDRWRLRVE
jgi:hypothetical protein